MMNNISRILAVTGVGLGAAIAVGAGSAQAAGTTAQSATNHTSSATRVGWRDDSVVGYFRTRTGCELTGRLGERRDRWDDYDCSPVRFGFNRGAWVLRVSQDDWCSGFDNDNWYGGWNNSWHGGDFNGGWNNRDRAHLPFLRLTPIR